MKSTDKRPTPATASEEVPDYRSDKIARLYNKPDSATAIECTCDNANGLHWGRCPINLKRKPESAAAYSVCECGHATIDHRREKDHDECTISECECDTIRPRQTPATASEHVAVAKLLSALREIASYDLNCAHETIAQAAIEDYEKSQRPIKDSPRRTLATASEEVPDYRSDKIARLYSKPDSASTGKHSMGEGANRSQRLRAHIPEYAGEWTVLKTYEDDAGQHALLCPLNIEGLYGALKPIAAAHNAALSEIRRGGEWTEETVSKIYATAMHPFRAIAVAYNAALRENNEKWRKEVKQFIERQHSLRDCGNDTKRLDLMETQGGQFAKIKGKSWRESADIHAAIPKTCEQTKER